MKAIIQRVRSASVSVEGKITGSIGRGMVILVGISKNETEENVNTVSEKCSQLRIFDDDNGKMNLSLKNIDGEALIISQFTLYADTKKGRRPSFSKAAPYKEAIKFYKQFINRFKEKGIHTETGQFGSKMLVEIHNDGPVTFILES
jgi:D-tyrosyl-tRNA(Tyr) deacylase